MTSTELKSIILPLLLSVTGHQSACDLNTKYT